MANDQQSRNLATKAAEIAGAKANSEGIIQRHEDNSATRINQSADDKYENSSPMPSPARITQASPMTTFVRGK